MAFDPKKKNDPGQGVLFTSENPRSDRAPTMWGVLRMDKDVKAGDIVKLVGWKHDTRRGLMVGLRIDNYDPNKPEFGRQEARPYQRGSVDDDEVPF